MTDSPRPLRGFQRPGAASAAGRRGHELGATRQWTREEAQQAARKAVERRQQQKAVKQEGAQSSVEVREKYRHLMDYTPRYQADPVAFAAAHGDIDAQKELLRRPIKKADDAS